MKLVRESITPVYNKLISIDIQPGHLDYINFNITDFVKYMEQFDDILYIFNGEELGYDSHASVKNFLVDNGANENFIDKIKFLEKEYGFFRGGMHEEIYEEDLKKVIKYMIENDINDSRDINFSEIYNIDDESTIDMLNQEPIFLPNFDINLVRKYNNSIVVGGAEDECLAEMEILFNVMDLNYEKRFKYIY